MADSERQRRAEFHAFEQDAALLETYHFDLLAQIEQQLRATRQAMRHVQKLRAAQFHKEPDASDGQRERTLVTLADEVAEIESHLSAQHECCAQMQSTIAAMRERVGALRRVATVLPSSPGRGQ